jgi:polar amino acid transport system substrate-binding protein
MSKRYVGIWLPPLTMIAGLILATMLVSPQKLQAQTKGKISYLILGSTVEPLMITKPDDPMAGGIITEIVELIFENSGYEIVPKVMPWKRMIEELRTGDDWINYGFPVGNEPGIPLEFSETPVMAFNHVAITLKSNHFNIDRVSDVAGRVAILVENFHYPGLDPHLDKPLVGKGSGEIKTVRAFTPKGTLRMLQHERGDVVFGFHARMLYNIKDTGLLLNELRFQDASAIIPSQPLYLTMSSQQPAKVKKLINDGLKRLAADGTLERILQKYSGPDGLVE